MVIVLFIDWLGLGFMVYRAVLGSVDNSNLCLLISYLHSFGVLVLDANTVPYC